jgi:putative hydrolase of the HAD superfamily
MTERWPIHTLVFDLDDTLYPERDFVLSGLSAVDAWLRAQHGVHGFEAHARQLFEAGRRGDIFDEALRRLQMPADPQLIAAMLDVYRSHAPQLHLYPDAADAISWAVSEKLSLALLTDGYAGVQRRKIRALELDRCIACCIVTDELGGSAFWKPHPAGFLQVMATHPGAAGGYLYVADNPRKDFIAPRQLGWRTLRVRRSGSEHAAFEAAAEANAELETSTLAALPQLLTRWGTGITPGEKDSVAGRLP